MLVSLLEILKIDSIVYVFDYNQASFSFMKFIQNITQFCVQIIVGTQMNSLKAFSSAKYVSDIFKLNLVRALSMHL